MNKSPIDNSGAVNAFGSNFNSITSGSSFQNSSVQGASTLKTTGLYEAPDERSSRLIREEADARIGRIESFVLFVVAIIIILTVITICIVILFNSKSSPSGVEWARNIISALIGALAGYITGKNVITK